MSELVEGEAGLRARAAANEQEHVGAFKREEFLLPPGRIYLDGNSLGALSVAARDAVTDAVNAQWGTGLVGSWNDAGWWHAPERVGDSIAALIGAEPGTVVVADSTSINLYKALYAASRLRPGRRVILTDPGSFPTDLHIASGLADTLGLVVEMVEPHQAAARLAGSSDVAVAAYSQVDFRTGELWDLASITAAAHAAGALSCWDVCHSAGAIEVEVGAGGADFAVGCGYKYLSGGPGAPAFLYVAPSHLGSFENPLRGWNGHAQPFAMSAEHRPADGITRGRVGSAPILGISALEGALTAYNGVTMRQVRARSLSLTELFIAALDEHGLGELLLTPRAGDRRGSQVSLRHEQAYAVVQALIARGVVGDFREPDIVRLGFAPLYVSHDDVLLAADHLAAVLRHSEFERPAFQQRAAVT